MIYCSIERQILKTLTISLEPIIGEGKVLAFTVTAKMIKMLYIEASLLNNMVMNLFQIILEKLLIMKKNSDNYY